MARIAGINIPQNKVVSVALTYIHGIGLHSSKKICKKEKNESVCIKKIQENHLLTEANQETRFCSSFDGTIIAYTSIGRGTPFLKAPNFVSSLEHDWRNPMWTQMYRFLANEYTLYRFDQRGNGLSDLDPENINFESFVKDMEAVVNNSQINKFPIFGIIESFINTPICTH